MRGIDDTEQRPKRFRRVLAWLIGGAVAVVLIIVLLVAAWLSGVLGYAIGRIDCGHAPIVTSGNIASAKTYRVPDSPWDGPDPFESYSCKNEAYLQEVGYEDEQTVWDRQEGPTMTDQMLQQSPVDYPVYRLAVLPTSTTSTEPQIMYAQDEKQVYYYVKSAKHAEAVALVRLGLKGSGSSNTVCGIVPDCQLHNKNKDGYDIYRGLDADSGQEFWGIDLPTTFVVLQQSGKHAHSQQVFNEQEILAAFNSLTLMISDQPE